MRRLVACFAGCAAAALATWSCTVEVSHDGEAAFQTITAVRAHTLEQQLFAEINFSAGAFRLTPDENVSLYRTEVVFDETHFDAEVEYEDGHLDIRVSPENMRGNVKWKDGEMQRMHLALSPHVPVSLDMMLGAVEADIELGGLSLEWLNLKNGASQTRVGFASPNRVTCDYMDLTVGAADFTVEGLGNARCSRLQIRGGVGALTLDFSGAWPDAAETDAEMKLGIGSVELRVPRGLGVRVQMSRIIAGFDAPGFVKQGDEYYSEGYDAAASKLHIDVTAVFGDITIRWIEQQPS